MIFGFLILVSLFQITDYHYNMKLNWLSKSDDYINGANGTNIQIIDSGNYDDVAQNIMFTTEFHF